MGLSEGDDLLAVPAGDTLTVFDQSGAVPDTPTGVGATGGPAQAHVSWTVPADNGNAVTNFTITPSIAGVAQTPVVIPAGTLGSSTSPCRGHRTVPPSPV